ncbi:hypothetical protein [Janthinobacterium fluminis]|uniref:Peptidase C-terminal archaeal/bacterial domain-containing protein n=1 Tax=Janthinobacterium fluminis TaxID=2987524 RepID=A0ABT5K830_9BURK|nr:hypothetical protein [Janthinobacterium fluminis]MDC8760600.1 hypothetical protein [Janthinobacterium fluminis]
MKKQLTGLVLAALGVCLFPAGSALAGSLLTATPSACGWINCASTTIQANVTTSSTVPGGAVEPFIIQVLAGGAYCTRLDVLAQNADMEIVVVSPNGTVWRNDDRPGSLRPLVVVPAGIQGWYAVHISPYNGFTGSPGVHYTASLAYGRYTPAGNANCLNPTPPSISGNATTKGISGMPRGMEEDK